MSAQTRRANNIAVEKRRRSCKTVSSGGAGHPAQVPTVVLIVQDWMDWTLFAGGRSKACSRPCVVASGAARFGSQVAADFLTKVVKMERSGYFDAPAEGPMQTRRRGRLVMAERLQTVDATKATSALVRGLLRRATPLLRDVTEIGDLACPALGITTRR
jgi:hypothetical protein